MMMMSGLTDVDMEAARQLVQLSEGETTTTTSSSSGSAGSCYSNFRAVVAADRKRKADDVITGENVLIRIRVSKKNDDNDNNNDNDINNKEVMGDNEVAGEIEENEEDVSFVRKNRRYRSLFDIYRVTHRL